MGNLIDRGCKTRDEGDGATGEHLLGVVVHGSIGQHVQVPDHSIRLPATNELDSVGVNAGDKQGCSSAGAEQAGVDLVWLDADSVGTADE